jgi:cell division protease FtsH
VPRGRALGYTLNLPHEDRYLKTREELIDHMTVLIAGRMAEQLVFGKVTTGASDDLKRVAQVARSMVYEYAMGTAGAAQRAITDGDADSEQFRRVRDEEQQELAFEASRAATELLSSHRGKLDEFAAALLEHEVLERGDIERIMDGVPRMERAPGRGLRVAVADPGLTPAAVVAAARSAARAVAEDAPGASRPSAPPPATPGL